jgi:hypothetical protein
MPSMLAGMGAVHLGLVSYLLASTAARLDASAAVFTIVLFVEPAVGAALVTRCTLGWSTAGSALQVDRQGAGPSNVAPFL